MVVRGDHPRVNRATPPSMQNATPVGRPATSPRCVCLTRARETGTRSLNTRSKMMDLPIITTTQRRANTIKDIENQQRRTSRNTTWFMQLMREPKPLGQAMSQPPPSVSNPVKQKPKMMPHM